MESPAVESYKSVADAGMCPVGPQFDNGHALVTDVIVFVAEYERTPFPVVGLKEPVTDQSVTKFAVVPDIFPA